MSPSIESSNEQQKNNTIFDLKLTISWSNGKTCNLQFMHKKNFSFETFTLKDSSVVLGNIVDGMDALLAFSEEILQTILKNNEESSFWY